MSDNQTASAMVAGRYQLEQRIAVGGMATVHRARDTVLDRPVAVKVLHEQFAGNPSFVTRFKREAQAAARLGHPNVVAVYDWGSHGDTYFIAMELIQGRTLAEQLAESGPFSVSRAMDISIEVTLALEAAHVQGTVHRDIKPSNVILGPSGGAKVADFGIARALQVQGDGDGDLTDAGSVIGTAGYLSPEQARGAPVDPRSDLYSLGVVLFEMLCGRRPFAGPSPVAVLHQHIDEAPPRVRDLRPAVPVEVDELIASLLSKHPDDRPATAAILLERLRALRSAGTPVAPSGAGSSDETAVMQSGAAAGSTTDEEDRLPPTAVMPPSARPDARQIAAQPPVAAPARSSRTGWPIVVGAVGIVGIVVLLLLASQTIGGDGDPGESPDATEQPSDQPTTPASTEDPLAEAIVVPDVRGATRADAETAIVNAGLVAVVETEQVAGDDDRVGRVISQSPDPDQRLDEGSQVRLVVGVASEATTTTVPRTTGPSTTTTQSSTTATSATQPTTPSTTSG